MKLAHAGFAVKDLDAGIALWQDLGFELTKQFEKEEPPAKAAFLRDENGAGVEIWEFTGEGMLSVIVGRHFAFLCEDVRADAEKLQEAGYKGVIPFTEGVTLDYIFLEDPFGTYFELAQPKAE